jgi:tetratricopeptide (TPR) repeat protein
MRSNISFHRRGPSRAEVLAEQARRKSNRFTGIALSVGALAVLVSVLYQDSDLRNHFSTLLDTLRTRLEVATNEAKDKPPTQAIPAIPSLPSAVPEEKGLKDRELEAAEQAYGPDHPAVATVLYRLGDQYRTAKRHQEQERAWLRAMSLLEKYRASPSDTRPGEAFDNKADKEMIARALGGFYWDQRRYVDSYKYYDLAYRFGGDLPANADSNRRLAYDSAGIMAGACMQGDWEIADRAMAELKERFKTVSPEDQRALQYWINTGEPRLKSRKC